MISATFWSAPTVGDELDFNPPGCELPFRDISRAKFAWGGGVGVVAEGGKGWILSSPQATVVTAETLSS